MLRGVLTLPAGIGETLRFAVFIKGDKAHEAKAAGADAFGPALLLCRSGRAR